MAQQPAVAAGYVQLKTVERPRVTEHSVAAILPILCHGRVLGYRIHVRARGRHATAAPLLRCLRSRRRPRCSRDITVPCGVAMISAISLYRKPTTSA